MPQTVRLDWPPALWAAVVAEARRDGLTFEAWLLRAVRINLDARRAPAARRPRCRACARCGRARPIAARDLCSSCYYQEYQRGRYAYCGQCRRWALNAGSRSVPICRACYMRRYRQEPRQAG